MIWVDRIAKKIKERRFPLEWVDDMKTPSGRIHVGSLRGVLIHDLIYKVLKENKINARFSYVFNNMDPMDGMPSYLDKKWENYMGVPLYKIPSPEKGYSNFGEYYAKEFIEVFNSLNCYPEIIWSSELYHSGKMNSIIKDFLNNANKVREIYKLVAKVNRADNWYPYSPICEKCGKIGTTNVYNWDGTYVYYRCEYHMVEWAKGCGFEGKIEPINENGKLPWKLDWPAHWKAIGVTIESSGKDHMSSGGSYDMASHFCNEILHTNPPEAMGGYEWFVIGGKKMSSSKGIGTTAKEASQILPPEVFRFLLVRTHIETHLDFNPYGVTILNLFDEYDKCVNAYFDVREKKIPQGKQGEVLEDFARIAFLSQTKELPKNRIFLPRFRTITNLLKNNSDIEKQFETQKGKPLDNDEKNILLERVRYAKIYLEKYSIVNTQLLTSPSQKPFILNENQEKFLVLLVEKLNTITQPTKENIQNIIFTILKEQDFKPKDVFQGFYQVLIGKDFGPKAAELIMSIGLDSTKTLLSKQNIH